MRRHVVCRRTRIDPGRESSKHLLEHSVEQKTEKKGPITRRLRKKKKGLNLNREALERWMNRIPEKNDQGGMGRLRIRVIFREPSRRVQSRRFENRTPRRGIGGPPLQIGVQILRIGVLRIGVQILRIGMRRIWRGIRRIWRGIRRIRREVQSFRTGIRERMAFPRSFWKGLRKRMGANRSSRKGLRSFRKRLRSFRKGLRSFRKGLRERRERMGSTESSRKALRNRDQTYGILRVIHLIDGGDCKSLF
jgi:hypothetical protein